MGIMTKHRFEVTQSTGDDDYLQRFPNGTAGQPSDGFKEDALRYGWPGTVTVSIRQGLVEGRTLVSPAGGHPFIIKGFTRTQQRCPGDAAIVFPRVAKPAPEFERTTRSKLMAAADFSKTIRGHYRFSDYTDARTSFDPKGPAPFAGPTFGPTRTVCSSFVRQALLGGGFTLDTDKSSPRPSSVHADTPDGLYFYDEDERKDSASILYTYLHNKVQTQIGAVTSATDPFWWIGLAPAASPGLVVIGQGTSLVSAGLLTSGTLINWATDAADDVASQVTNCFASDYCSESAKDSDQWEEPGTGTAVGPDDILNHYDSPATNGPYGYNERMVFRGKDFRPIYEWRPAGGTIPVAVRVLNADRSPASLALVTMPGFLVEPVVADANGYVLIEGVPRGNIRLTASRFVGDPVTGTRLEGQACFVSATDPLVPGFQRTDCNGFLVLDPAFLTEAEIVLGPPPADRRKVVISSATTLEDCDCNSPNDVTHPNLFAVCLVSPLERIAHVGAPTTDLCSDEVGVRFEGTCELLPDNRTVRVDVSLAFYEDTSGTCGGYDKDDAAKNRVATTSFTTTVAADTIATPSVNTLSANDICVFPLNDCTDRATFSNFKVENMRAD